MNEIEFDKLGISKSTLKAISKKKFKIASEVQAKVIPLVFEQKHDIVGIAQTGTGKTGAFGIPLVDLIEKHNKFPQAIILAPTRELALQVTSELTMFASEKRLKIATIYGGASIRNQISALKRGVDIVVGTPGRVVDLINKRELELKECKYFILDEADEMLKMGFIEDVELILEKSSKKRRVYLFSATMPPRIKKLSEKYMKKQKVVEVERKLTVSNLIEQFFYKVKDSDKFNTLQNIVKEELFFYGIVFCKTKRDVEHITQSLKRKKIRVDCIHGDIAQNKRERILKLFKDQKISVLVATDVAARGIDVKNLTHVINYNLPQDAETYTHRIGRTGRAGKKGKAISLVTPSEMRKLTYIENELDITIEKRQLSIEQKSNEPEIITEVDEIISKANIKKYVKMKDELSKKHSKDEIIQALLHKISNNSRR